MKVCPSKIHACRPHLADVLAHIRQSPEPVMRRNIRKDLSYIPDRELDRDLQFAIQEGFCNRKRAIDPIRGQSVFAYGPITLRGQRYLAKVRAEVAQ